MDNFDAAGQIAAYFERLDRTKGMSLITPGTARCDR